MTPNLHGLLDWTIAGVVFALVFSVWLGVVLVWAGRRRRRQERLEGRFRGAVAPARSASEHHVLRLWHEGHEVTTTAAGRYRPTLKSRLDRARQNAGWHLPVPTLLVLLAGLVVGAAVLVFVLTGSLISTIAVVVAIVVAANMYLRHCIERREALFEARFLDALQIAVRSLRAGHPLIGAFHFVAEEGGPPVSELFEEVCQQQALGMSLEDALRRVTDRYPSPDLRLFVSSIEVQLRGGGPLADMMERLADVIRDRMRVTRRARVLAAQTQFSKRILLALPIVLFAVLAVVNPHYLEPLFTSDLGRILLSIAGVNLLLGIWVMNRLAVIRF
jgi:tight adherence protein B